MYLQCECVDGMRDVNYVNAEGKVRRTMIVCACSGLPRPGEGPRPGEREISSDEALLYENIRTSPVEPGETPLQAAA